MNALELKGGIYDLIAQVNDKDLLAKMHAMISQLISQNDEQVDFMDELPDEIQNEVRIAYQESFDEKNLVSEKEAMEEIQKWRKKG